MLERVGLASEAADRYPHELSAGQRQRIGIARALAVAPDFVVCDEPIGSLDVSVQAQVVNLLLELQESMRVSYLFISHDLRMVRHVSHRVAVMYFGRLVEVGPAHAVLASPLHPYTRALLSAVPTPDPTCKRLRIVLEGESPSPFEPPSGCAFHPRCPKADRGACVESAPLLLEVGAGTHHRAACWHPGA
jgi:oligopeptide/dipeptide ABC transporter ATP-binding protein